MSNVGSMGGMFYGASSFNQDISNWDVANIYDISSMFYGASSFNRKYVSRWDVDDFDEMFCSLFRTDEDIRVAVKLMVLIILMT